jgi:glyoxylase-like metal-dependent hydrolase (beta-lactamase superfamily II)
VQGIQNPPRAYPAISDTMEIVPGIHQVEEVNGNCYVIVRDGIFIVDTGLPGASKKILPYIQDTLGKNPSDIKTIILPENHLDNLSSSTLFFSSSSEEKKSLTFAF